MTDNTPRLHCFYLACTTRPARWTPPHAEKKKQLQLAGHPAAREPDRHLQHPASMSAPTVHQDFEANFPPAEAGALDPPPHAEKKKQLQLAGHPAAREPDRHLQHPASMSAPTVHQDFEANFPPAEASFRDPWPRAGSVECELSVQLLKKFRPGEVREGAIDRALDGHPPTTPDYSPTSPDEWAPTDDLEVDSHGLGVYEYRSPDYSPTSPAPPSLPPFFFLNGLPEGLTLKVLELLFPMYIDLRTALRLASVCKEFARGLMPIIEQWVVVHLAKVGWQQVKFAALPAIRMSACWCPDPDSKWRTKWITVSEVRSKAPNMRVAHAGKVYEPVVATAKKAWQQLRSKLCRECFTPTTSVCRVNGGGSVRVCVKCQKEGPNMYSCLLKRMHARMLVASKTKKNPVWLALHKADVELLEFRPPRIGYFWHCDVVEAGKRLVEKEDALKKLQTRLSERAEQRNYCIRVVN